MEVSDASNAILADLLEAHTGQELLPARRWRIGSALAGIMRELGLAHADALIARVNRDRNGPLARRVIEALLNNETYFFRDKALFDLLGQRALPDLARRRADTARLSIWSVGCSTGQEALSLAMMLAEQEPRWAGWRIDILATDVSEAVVDAARRGVYSQFQVQRGLGVMQMLRWFDETPEGWKVSDRLTRSITWRVHNLLDPLPGAPAFDLVLCRNVLLYFDAERRGQAFDRLVSAMAPDGLLMLGAGETVHRRSRQFRSPDPEFAGLFCRDRHEHDGARPRPAPRRQSA
jgi:chemotaxis protein methyltransferase CheR